MIWTKLNEILNFKTGKLNLIHYCAISTPAQQQHCLFSGWHHRVNGKAGGNPLGFYRLVPLLLREAELVTIAVETGDLSRYCSPRSIQQQAALETLWNHYVDGMKTSRFLERAGELYAIRQ